MSGNGFRADPEAMAQLTKGIKLAMDELKELGFDIDANLGRGFDELELAGLEVGDAGLQETFAGFCDRWGWGVRTLMQDANKFALMLDLSAGMYHEEEEYGKNVFKTVLNQVGGNPYATEEDIKRQSVSEALESSNIVGHVRDADYSMDSFRDAKDEIGDQWDQAGEDLDSSTLTPWRDSSNWEPDGPEEETFTPAQKPGDGSPDAEGGKG
ncbi:hypothetical protein QIS99_04895 [Streptomyces sp. B-S-A8]|uniref:Uncharacterized protein n=1 Tax=Streptomyces solicavernae TaxID=3043614 RepID=A0ABT6RMF7_9ACTN|nr:hypothetical protein [Streptomyces sp. B-S-A8]MDI3385555.1 hypothetical protein [Streptomyces sp. B-S-A8]